MIEITDIHTRIEKTNNDYVHVEVTRNGVTVFDTRKNLYPLYLNTDYDYSVAITVRCRNNKDINTQHVYAVCELPLSEMECQHPSNS